MSNLPELELDLEKLFLPTWAKQSPDTNRYAKYEGRDTNPERGRDDRRGGGGGGGGRRDDRRGPPRRDGGAGGGAGGRPAGGFGGPRRDDRRRDEPREERREAPPLPEIAVSLLPEERGAEALAKQIKLTGRAYALFDIGFLVLKKPERYQVRFDVVKKADGSVVQPLFLCSLDDTLWLSEAEAGTHLLQRHFDTFYQTERVAGEAPKGTYTFVAQCGFSGAILGPPNYHDYQNKLRKLHAERFPRMPFDDFKARVKIVKDEAVVKQWVEESSVKTVFTALNVTETIKFNTREEVEKHFRETHLANLVKPVTSHLINGAAAQQAPSPAIRALVRCEWEQQSHFPLKIVNVLSNQFAGHGLQFFKVNKTVTHAAVARPHYLDLDATPVSDGIKRIIDFINATSKCTRRKLLDALAHATSAAAPAGGDPTAPAEAPATTPEQQAVIADLHWLVHQGHVIEFASGLMETAKKPLPRVEKPARQAPAEAKPAAAVVASEVAPMSAAPAPAPTEVPTIVSAPANIPADATLNPPAAV